MRCNSSKESDRQVLGQPSRQCSPLGLVICIYPEDLLKYIYVDMNVRVFVVEMELVELDLEPLSLIAPGNVVPLPCLFK